MLILAVLLIHAEPFGDSLVHEYGINRAVPVFVVFFGMTSELWWRERAEVAWPRDLRDWYARRFRRLLVGLWGFVVLWWTAALLLVPEWLPYGPRFLVASFAGFLP